MWRSIKWYNLKATSYAFQASPKVLSVIFRTGNIHFAGATQLLPLNITKEQSKEALATFAAAVAKQFTSQGKTPKLPASSFQWREFRTATKNLLSAVANALQVALPSGFSFASCMPQKQLVPRGPRADRIELLPEEREMLGYGHMPKDAKLHFVYNYESQTRWADFVEDRSFFKLSFSADEGTEARGQ